MTSTILAITFPLARTSAIGAVAAILVGCGNPEVQQPGRSPSPSHVTFTRDVAPILFQNCAGCHRPGEAGPFNLLTYQDAKKHAEQLVYVTQQGIMPPWLPEPACEEFVGDRRLTIEQIETFRQWVDRGTVEGNSADLPELPRWTEGWQQGQPDLIFQLPEPFQLQAEGFDVFHTYVIPIPISSTQYVTAVEMRPQNRRVVHHALLFTDRTASLRNLDDQHPGPGFPGTEVGNAQWPEGHMPGYLPGRQVFQGPEDIAWRLEPGTDAVIQLHMVPSGKREIVDLKIGLYWADSPPKREAMLLQLTRRDIDIPAGEKHYVVRDDFILPVDVEVLAVQPHAHYLGTTVSGMALLPDGTKKTLLHIKQWDFNWQEGYEYLEPVYLPKNTKIAMQFAFDNSADNVRNPHHPPRRVTTGWNTRDEMAELWLQLLPKNPADLAALKRHNQEKRLRVQLESELWYYQEALRIKPNNAEARVKLGNALNELGRAEEAVAHYQEALRIEPNLAEAHIKLANVLNDLGRVEEAVAHYQEALRIKPDHVEDPKETPNK